MAEVMKPQDKVDWAFVVFFWLLAGAALALLFKIPDAHAAKLRVTWIAPTTNADGTPLTDLAGYRIEWGSCLAPGVFGTYQAGINAPANATSAWIYPTGLNPVCVRLYALNSKNVSSFPAYASGLAPPTLSKPIQ